MLATATPRIVRQLQMTAAPLRRKRAHAVAVCMFLVSVLTVAGATYANDLRPSFALPIECRPGVDCWIAKYVDHDPSGGVRDYLCGQRASDGHGGTDFAVRDLARMAEGVTVMAAADGVVRAVRDGMDDVAASERSRDALHGRECGNGVVLEHAAGWSSQYCHLRRGSVVVRPGQSVGAGAPLGLVGMSGLADFPHVEFGVRHLDRRIDPFVGRERDTDCQPGPRPLWRPDVFAALPYQPIPLYNAGFAVSEPRVEAVRRGEHRAIEFPAAAPALVYFVEAFGLRSGDELHLSLAAPDGTVLAQRRISIQRDAARYFGFVGKRRGAQQWSPGVYRGGATVTRRDAAGTYEVTRGDEATLRAP